MRRSKVARRDVGHPEDTYASPASLRRLQTHTGPSTWLSPQTEHAPAPAWQSLTSPWQLRGPDSGPVDDEVADQGPTDAGDQNAGPEQLPERLTAERWLSCVYKAGQLGIAAYDRMSNKLSVMQTPDESKGACAFQMLQYIKLQVDPEVIILPATADAALLSAAKVPAAAAMGAISPDPAQDADSTRELLVQLQRPSLFTYDKALKMLKSVSISPQQQHHLVQDSCSVHPASLINISYQQQVSALGALLAVLLQQQEEESGVNEGALTVDGLREMTLEGHLLIDGPTLAALDVFKEEDHPSAMGIGTSKEGVSIYGLLQRCFTGMGKRLMRQWFLRPVVQLDVISGRHDAIELLVAAPDVVAAIKAVLSKVQDLPRLLTRLRLLQAQPQLQTFKQMSDSIGQLMQLRQLVATLAPAAAQAEQLSSSAEQLQQQQPQPPQDKLPSWLQPERDFSLDPTDSVNWNRGQPGVLDDQRQQHQQAGPWDNLAIVQKLLNCISTHLQACGALINDVLDFSCPVEGCLLQPGVCESLDELKATQQALPELLTQVVEAELQRVPPHVARRYSKQLWSMEYIPQVGFVMCVTGGRLSEELAEMLQDYKLAFMSEDGPAIAATADAASDGAAGHADAANAAGQLDSICAYYYSNCTQQLNSRFGDLQHKIKDLEASICTELIKRLLSFSSCLSAASDAVAELDCLCSFAAVARELGYCRPTLTTDNVVFIQGGRHPLTELLAQGTFIPNHTAMGDVQNTVGNTWSSEVHHRGMEHEQQQPVTMDRDGLAEASTVPYPRIQLITGPNASGKSVYMKQVALLVYLAHVGSFIPAEQAVIGLTDRILTRLPGMEQVAQHTSSFMADLGQVSTILDRATERSLVLLDEFGKGTLTSDGVGLLAAIVQHYAAQPCPPFVLACTHFHELLSTDVLTIHHQIELCNMQVLVAEQDAGQADQPVHKQEHVFLYKLVKGHAPASYGLHCARMCGIPEAVLARAADVLSLQQSGHAIQRLQLPQLQQRDEQYWQLLQKLARTQLSDQQAVISLLQSVLQVEAAATES